MKTFLISFILIATLFAVSFFPGHSQTWTDQHNIAPAGFTSNGTDVYKVSLSKTNLNISGQLISSFRFRGNLMKPELQQCTPGLYTWQMVNESKGRKAGNGKLIVR